MYPILSLVYLDQSVIEANYLDGKNIKKIKIDKTKPLIPGYDFFLEINDGISSMVEIKKYDVESGYGFFNLVKDLIGLFNKLNPLQATSNYCKGGIYIQGSRLYYLLEPTTNGRFNSIELTSGTQSELVILHESFYVNNYVANIYLTLHNMIHNIGVVGYGKLRFKNRVNTDKLVQVLLQYLTSDDQIDIKDPKSIVKILPIIDKVDKQLLKDIKTSLEIE